MVHCEVYHACANLLCEYINKYKKYRNNGSNQAEKFYISKSIKQHQLDVLVINIGKDFKP